MSLLNKRFETPYNTAPFSKIKTEDFLPAFVKAIEIAKIEITELADSKETPTFKNTIEALDYAGEPLDRISSIFFNLNAAETSESIQKIAQEVSPLLTEFSNDVALNTPLFERVKLVYNSRSSLSLSKEQAHANLGWVRHHGRGLLQPPTPASSFDNMPNVHMLVLTISTPSIRDTRFTFAIF